jgi:hypothetical protein
MSRERGTRRNLLDCLERISEKAPRLRIFATCRELQGIKEGTDSLQAEIVLISEHLVDADIRKYVASELSRHRRLRRLGGATKILIMETFAEKADGMYGSLQ